MLVKTRNFVIGKSVYSINSRSKT